MLHDFHADRAGSAVDLVTFCLNLTKGHECVFGSRFSRVNFLVDYPLLKLVFAGLLSLRGG